MATGHWLTTKGLLVLAAQGDWADAGATAIKVGLLVGSQPAGLDTAAEVANLDFVAELLTSGSGLATEAAFTNYARKDLSRTAAEEDDTNDRVDLDVSDVTWSSAGGASNETVIGAFFYTTSSGSTDADYPLLSVDWFSSGTTTNGGDLTLSYTDVYRIS